MKKGKGRNRQKRKQKKGVREAARKMLYKKAKASVRDYMRGSRRQAMVDIDKEKVAGQVADQVLDQRQDDDIVSIDNEATFARCDGVGECCKNRAIFVEPSDVFRIFHNERARKKFGIETTMDLYPSESTSAPLSVYLDKKTLTPFCSVFRVNLHELLKTKEQCKHVQSIAFNPGSDDQAADQVCPFFEVGDDGKPECILGEDRLSQCLSDPVVRMNRLNTGRRLHSFNHAINAEPCTGCRSADDKSDRTVVVKDWLIEKGAEDRAVDADWFHGFIAWFRSCSSVLGEEAKEAVWGIATTLIFNWHSFVMKDLKQSKTMALENSPETPSQIYAGARMVLEGIVASEQQKKDDDKGTSESD